MRLFSSRLSSELSSELSTFRSAQMMNTTMTPIQHEIFDAAALLGQHPPVWNHATKLAVFDLVVSANGGFAGTIDYARWDQESIPPILTQRSNCTISEGIYTYAPPANDADVHWHVNFADPHLFIAYGSALMAQDEIQAAEHPALGSLLEALVAAGLPTLTATRDGRATPVTIAGVERHCSIDTLPRPEQGRPQGLYGNLFASATKKQIKDAVDVLTPPTVSNIVAMAAPYPSSGRYTAAQISSVVSTAYTAFAAASRETTRLHGDSARTTIHSGHWGCGAFGGNRTLMTILQLLSADLANVDLRFWAFDEEGSRIASEALLHYEELIARSASVATLLQALESEGYLWGQSDGN